MKYTTLKTKKDTIDSEVIALEQQLKEQQNQIKILEEKKITLQQQLTRLDAKKGEELKIKKNDLQKQIDSFSELSDKEKILDFVGENSGLFKEFILRGDFSDFKNIIQILIDQGKILKLEQENVQARIKNKQEELVILEKSL